MVLHRKSAWWAPVLIGIPLVVAACSGGGDDDPTPTRGAAATVVSSEATPTPQTTPEAARIDVSSPSGITGADPEFNYSAMVWRVLVSRDISARLPWLRHGQPVEPHGQIRRHEDGGWNGY